MRLGIISENIKRQDFYDFYSLEYAYHKFKDEKVEKNLNHLAQLILTDHLNQLGKILIGRLADLDDEDTVGILQRHGVKITSYQHRGSEYQEWSGIEELTLKQKIEAVAALVRQNKGTRFTGDTWFGLGKTFLELVKMGSSRQSRIMAIDKLYNLLHHGGFIVDYMDENDWLEDALHTRDVANPAQLFALASPRVRALIGRSSYSGMDRRPVDDISKLHTALRRVAQDNGISIVRDQNRITITIEFTSMLLGGRMLYYYIGDEMPSRYQELLDKGLVTIGQTLRGTINIEDIGDKLIVSNDIGEVIVSKPINRQHELAGDLLRCTVISTRNSEKPRLTGKYFRKD